MEETTITSDKIKPVGDRLLLEVYKSAEKVGSFELAPSKGYATPVLGKVLRAGPKAQYAEDDIVMFRRFSVDSVKLLDESGEEKEFYMLEGSEVIAVVE